MNPTPYTSEELVQALKDRQSGQTLQMYAAEIGISYQLLSQIFLGQRSVGNDKVLAYLAPKGFEYVHEDVYYLKQK